MAWLLVLTAILVGVILPLQAGINAELRQWLGHPVQAAFISFLFGTLALLLLGLGLRLPLESAQPLGGAPWWVWFGGLFGAAYVSMSVVLAPRLGAATLISSVMAGQLVGSLIMDHYGLVGYALRPITLERILGAGLLVAGVLLIQRS